MYGIVFTLLFSIALCDNIIDLTNRKYVLVETDPVFIYQDTAFLYHISNLSKIIAPYESIMKSSYNLENQPESQILMNKIETLKNQLIPNIYRPKKSLNFLGSVLKFITGTPDHDDLVEIKTSQFERYSKPLIPKQ